MFKTGNHSENPFLLRKLKPGLEANQIIECTFRIVLPQLYNGKRLLPGSRIRQANRFERSKRQYHFSTPGHGFHGHTALEYFFLLKAMDFCSFRMNQCIDKCMILFFGHGAVQVVVAAPIP